MNTEDFTLSKVINNIQVDDTIVDIIGYVTKVSQNFHTSPGKTKFYKFVVNNAEGKEVQVVAWNEKTDKLTKVKEMGKIMYVASTKAFAIKDSRYNNGKVDIELLIKDNSEIEVFDTYQEKNHVPVEEVSFLGAFEKINKNIKIRLELQV